MEWGDITWELLPNNPVVIKQEIKQESKPELPPLPPEEIRIPVQTVDFEKITNFVPNESNSQQRDDHRDQRKKVERPVKKTRKTPVSKTANRKTANKKG